MESQRKRKQADVSTFTTSRKSKNGENVKLTERLDSTEKQIMR